MDRFVYAYSFEREDGEVLFRFPKIDRIISGVSEAELAEMSPEKIDEHAHDAVIEALQTYTAGRESLPEMDDPRFKDADGFVRLTPQEAMKLELYKVYKENCQTVGEFANKISRSATVARRLLDLRYRSAPKEIANAIEVFGKQLVHSWSVEEASKPVDASRASSLEYC